MSETRRSGMSRRDLMKTSGKVAAASALAGVVLPQVHAGENNTIQVALVGCGSRGTGAAENALSVRNGPIRLVAMADVFPARLSGSYNSLHRSFAAQMDVPESRRFIGFDGYRRAMDCLRRNDVVILTTPPAFRWPHFTYAIERGINVFMEKPTTVDGPSTRRMFQLAEQSERANLKVGVGLMCRHCTARGELFNRIRDGQMGDINLLRCYRQHGPVGHAFVGPKPAGISELLYQVQEFHAFLWASGGCFSDFYIHNIDECCWMKDAWPTQAQASGGRHYRGNNVDQNFDSYSVEYTFADGAKMFLEGRCIEGAHQQFSSLAHGTRGSAIISWSGHTPSRARIFRGQNNVITNTRDVAWRAPQQEPNPYQLEWDHLIDAIRRDRRHNEARRGAEASLVTAMGRMAAHTGVVITRDQMLNCDHEFAPQVDRLAMDSAAPLRADNNGKYAVPQPGINTRREF
ncbi:MAG: gfo/Idh/MocA family oxidoreductase [Planctomycetes bacterium]|nr:gfo/Idh/MocA family oxidoreductase [Planctomycetota bacterium]